MRPFIYFFFAVLLSFLWIACENGSPGAGEGTIAEEAPAKPQSDGVFIHVSSGPNNPQRILMALQMAALMSEDRDVLVYFDIEAVSVVLKDAVDISFAQFPSSITQLDKLIERGVPLLVCPGCLEALKIKPEQVREGVQIAEKEKFFSFTEGRILTLDY
jgi:predicted peroxiredoxin